MNIFKDNRDRNTSIVIDTRTGVWIVTKSKWATVFVRPVKDKWDERTTTVYREMWDIVKIVPGIVDLVSKVAYPHIYSWEARYYKDCPPVIGDKTLPDDRMKPKQPADWSGPATSYSEAVGIVCDAIGYPRDNAKLKEFLG